MLFLFKRRQLDGVVNTKKNVKASFSSLSFQICVSTMPVKIASIGRCSDDFLLGDLPAAYLMFTTLFLFLFLFLFFFGRLSSLVSTAFRSYMGSHMAISVQVKYGKEFGQPGYPSVLNGYTVSEGQLEFRHTRLQAI